MSLTQLKVTLPYVTGLPQDVATNTWYFDGALGPVGIMGEAGPRIVDFYQGLETYLSSYIDGSNCNITAYDMTEPSPRAPVGELPFTISPASGSSLPLEVSLCLSYKAAHTPGVSVARERGRLYIGPWNVNAIEPSQPASRPTNDMINDMAILGADLLSANTSDATWVVYSPTQGGALEIVSGWVDNAWDTQRRRGSSASDRLIFAPTP